MPCNKFVRTHLKPEENQFANLVRVEIKNNRAIRRTVSIPEWLDERATKEGLSLSKILQDALKNRFDI